MVRPNTIAIPLSHRHGNIVTRLQPKESSSQRTVQPPRLPQRLAHPPDENALADSRDVFSVELRVDGLPELVLHVRWELGESKRVWICFDEAVGLQAGDVLWMAREG